MPARRTATRALLLPEPGAIQDQELLMIVLRGGNTRTPPTIAIQWHDGAGELHYEALSPELSAEYLVEG